MCITLKAIVRAPFSGGSMNHAASKTEATPAPGPIQRHVLRTGARGLDVRTTAQLLRRYIHVQRGMMRMLAGWFLAAPPWEVKHTFGYHLFDHCEHVDAWRQRLQEMRGGPPNASIEPALATA